MITILRKNLQPFLLYSLMLLLPAALLWAFHHEERLFGIAVFVHLSVTFVITTMTVLMNEQEEDFHKGYRFLQTLPLRRRQVTGAKFLLPLIMIAVLGLVNRGIFIFFSPGTDALALTDRITWLFAIFFLLNCGLIYVGVYLLGYMTFIKTVSGMVTGGILAAFIAAKLFHFQTSQLVDLANAIQDWLLHGNHLPVLLGGLTVYLLLGILANAVEKRS